MSIDMEQFHGVFFDESREHLDEMEQQLMDLDLSAPDAEEVNSIFRAAHSIKGGSSIFGFEALTDVTHIMENLLDQARQGTMQLTTPMVNLFLETVDTLKTTLNNYRNKESVDQASITLSVKKLQAFLTRDVELEDRNDEAFGFFDKAQEDDEGFGFFEPLVESPAALAQADEGYGFFDSLENIKAKRVQRQKTLESLAAVESKIPAKSRAKKETITETSSIRVDINKIDSLVNLVGELVITQSMLTMIGAEVSGAVEEKLETALAELQRNTREIQEAVMSMRMLPMSVTFNRFPRFARDLSSKLGKKVDLQIEGGNTEIDKGMIEKLIDPLTHLVRNSIDHGIETTEKRRELGKAETGTVRLKAQQQGSSIVISIVDDGAGLDRQGILTKAKEKGFAPDENMPDTQVWQLIFAAGFSTVEQVTDVSGRGVGMDVVRRNIEALGGRIEVTSMAGMGAQFHIHLPLTLAIVDGMCVSVGEQIFVVPLLNIVESIQPTKEQIKFISNDNLLWIREQYWPLVRLHKNLQIEDAITDPHKGIVVLIESNNKRFGILVDALLGQQQVVIKSLEKHYRRVAGVAGATIMGDGGVAMILDVESLAGLVKSTSIESENK